MPGFEPGAAVLEAQTQPLCYAVSCIDGIFFVHLYSDVTKRSVLINRMNYLTNSLFHSFSHSLSHTHTRTHAQMHALTHAHTYTSEHALIHSFSFSSQEGIPFFLLLFSDKETPF